MISTSPQMRSRSASSQAQHIRGLLSSRKPRSGYPGPIYPVLDAEWVPTLASLGRDDKRGSLHHLRYEKKVILRSGRILQDIVRKAAIGHHILAFLHRHRRHRGHRLDPLDVDFL